MPSTSAQISDTHTGHPSDPHYDLNTLPNDSDYTEDFADLEHVRLCYRDSGPKDAPPILLIMGLGCQLTTWPPEFVNGLLALGYRVIRFDNRELGLSSLADNPGRSHSPPAGFLRYKLGLKVTSDYTLHDLAEDTRQLIKYLELDKPIVLGVSMGGMVAQILAAKHSDLISKLILLMSSDNHPRLPAPSVKTLWRITGGGIQGDHQEAAINRGLAFWNTVSSPGYPSTKRRIISRIARDYQRSYRPKSIIRQMVAIQATGSIRPESESIALPTLIMHGLADKLVHPKAGRQLHRNIKGSKLELIKGWGHDVPVGLVPEILNHIDNFVS
ncbi:alpha/beta hydrolase [Allohahella marinimesophila]|uniref:Alpha/beta hydrolase n=1 Tax=Allohahella marinimesophila TaxID=1054972 RepID=A0ABP7P8V4_9GAMM